MRDLKAEPKFPDLSSRVGAIRQEFALRTTRILLRIFSTLRHCTDMNHISDHDLERYYLGMVADEVELAALEEHYLGCPECAKRAAESAQYVDTIRAALVTGGRSPISIRYNR
jgi:hypothetical protein